MNHLSSLNAHVPDLSVRKRDFSGSCPVCNGHFAFSPEFGKFFCFDCHIGGTIDRLDAVVLSAKKEKRKQEKLPAKSILETMVRALFGGQHGRI